MLNKKDINKMKPSELLTNNLNPDHGSGIHHKWFLGFCHIKVISDKKENFGQVAARNDAAMIKRVRKRDRWFFFEKVSSLFKGKKRMPVPSPLKKPKTWAQTSVFSPWLNRAIRTVPAKTGIRLSSLRGFLLCVIWKATRSPAAAIMAVEAPMERWAVL